MVVANRGSNTFCSAEMLCSDFETCANSLFGGTKSLYCGSGFYLLDEEYVYTETSCDIFHDMIKGCLPELGDPCVDLL